jgi:alkanesulfonate monooxygenase SsuD/methylene tetrahydromethanopterin reductase-like flavin-dependent oxidoreductase (luciferase family)
MVDVDSTVTQGQPRWNAAMVFSGTTCHATMGLIRNISAGRFVSDVCRSAPCFLKPRSAPIPTRSTCARTIEELGYDHMVIFDHVLGADAGRLGGWTGVYDHRSMFHEPFVLYGYLAAITTRLRLATAVIVLPQRQTALVAKQARGGRALSRQLILGVGIG